MIKSTLVILAQAVTKLQVSTGGPCHRYSVREETAEVDRDDAWACGHNHEDDAVWAKQGGVMAKRHCRPSAQYRYEHYDPF